MQTQADKARPFISVESSGLKAETVVGKNWSIDDSLHPTARERAKVSLIDELNNLHLYDSSLLGHSKTKRIQKFTIPDAGLSQIKSPILERAQQARQAKQKKGRKTMADNDFGSRFNTVARMST